jgi:predicted ribosome-associated RNA-binding protein Tma20
VSVTFTAHHACSQGHIQLLLKDGQPLFFTTRDGPWCPVLRVVHQYPEIMKKLRVDSGAIKFVLAGANVMCPGLTSECATIHDEVSTTTMAHAGPHRCSPRPAVLVYMQETQTACWVLHDPCQPS